VSAGSLVSSKEDGAPREVVAVEPQTPVRAALEFITGHNISQLPVIADGDCVGHLSEATLMSRVLEDPSVLDRAVRELMDAPLPVVDAHLDLGAVTRLLTRQNPAVLVRRSGQLSGIITRYDVLRYVTG
jgi:cystathionine beta-synthase